MKIQTLALHIYPQTTGTPKMGMYTPSTWVHTVEKWTPSDVLWQCPPPTAGCMRNLCFHDPDTGFS